jgi:hypothetical protein
MSPFSSQREIMLVLTRQSAAASSGVIIPLGSMHRSHRFCGETNGRLTTLFVSFVFLNLFCIFIV